MDNNAGVRFVVVQIGGVFLEPQTLSMHLRFLWENVS